MSTRQTWREVSPIAAEIIEGKYDDQISLIQQACTARLKQAFRKGALVEVTQGQLMGVTGTVIKVNPKRVSVDLGERGQWNIPPSSLQVVPR